MKRLIRNISYKFRLAHKRAVPHISLAGSLTTTNENRLVNDFRTLCLEYPLMSFKIDGFNVFEGNRVVFIDIKPSQGLDEFRWEICKKLGSYCKLKHPYDYQREWYPHATIAMNLDHNRFNKIKDYVSRLQQPKYKHFMLRATLIKGQRILYEYDFLQRRLLNRWEAKNPMQYQKTMNLLKEFFKGRYDPNKRLETRQVKKESFWEKILHLFRKPKIFFTSDLHLDHANIIKYCKRPFTNVTQMNKVLVENWNNIISPKDTVYFLGDLAYGYGSKSTDYWLEKLNGNIIFIKGNHDKSNKIKLYENKTFEYKGYKFFLTHSPDNVPKDWKEWAICGHHHNNKPQECPLINKQTKRINISVELTEYRPMEINDLIKMIEQ
ncbi:MAG: 2'-5' RNA ligase family protein [Nanoarchaeota archaeon]|nr:2'-5' RNA ligase family protein [Nanoarchaeota archaeon]